MLLTNTLITLLKETFDSASVLQWAREVGALTRLRLIHPLDFCTALVGCAMGDEERSIASARRLFGKITGFAPEESSFYDRFTDAMLVVMRRMFAHVLGKLSAVQRDVVAAALGGTGIVDILAADATQGLLPASAVDALPSTDEDHGGFKLTAVLSVLFQRLEEVVVTDARTHDRKGLRLRRWLHGLLYLFDRGYSDFRLFVTIALRKGYFVTRMKKSFSPTITAVHSGLGQAHIGSRWNQDLPFRGVVDLDAEFQVRGLGRWVFRVIRITVDGQYRAGRRERVHIWLVTNLTREQFSAQQVATLYRLRWEVEVLFRTLKSVGRLDQLRSANVSVVHAFICATLVGMLLAHEVCAQMRREWPDREPSPYRVATLVFLWLPELAGSLRTRRQQHTMESFVFALWREGCNPNPGRPYMATQYSRDLRAGA